MFVVMLSRGNFGKQERPDAGLICKCLGENRERRAGARDGFPVWKPHYLFPATQIRAFPRVHSRLFAQRIAQRRYTCIHTRMYIRIHTTRVCHVGCPTRSKSRQNFAPGVFNSKLPGDREGRHCAHNGNFGVNREILSGRKSTCWKYF